MTQQTSTATTTATDEDVMVHHAQCSNPSHPDYDECAITTDGWGSDAGTVDWSITANPSEDIGIVGRAEVTLTISTEADRRDAVAHLAELIARIAGMQLDPAPD